MEIYALTSEYVDIGANLTHSSFAADREAVLERAFNAGVRRLIVTGADLASSRQALLLAQAYDARLWSTAGVHPHHAQDFIPSQREEFLLLLRSARVVAVGECGLDYFRNLSPPGVQRAAFMAQLELAVEVGKPVFLHQRDAHADFVAILREFAGRLAGGVAHCFTGGPAQLEDYLMLGLHIGITGWVCDERRGHELREAAPRVPPERLMVETDAPYLLPRDLQTRAKSRRNEPSYLPHVAAALAKLRGVTLEALAVSTTGNAERFFGLPPAATSS